MIYKEQIAVFKEKKNYIQFFPDFVDCFDFDKAIYISFLMYRSKPYKVDGNIDEWFPVSNSIIQDKTKLTIGSIRTAQKFFLEIGMIKRELRGRNSYIQINWDALMFCHNECDRMFDNNPKHRCRSRHLSKKKNRCRSRHLNRCRIRHVNSENRCRSRHLSDSDKNIDLGQQTSGSNGDPLARAGDLKEVTTKKSKKKKEKHTRKARKSSISFLSKKHSSSIKVNIPKKEERLIDIDSQENKDTWQQYILDQTLSPEKIFWAWNAVAHIKCESLNSKGRVAQIKKRINQHQTSDWVRFFEEIEKYKNTSWTMQKNWFTLDRIMADDKNTGVSNVLRVIEGQLSLPDYKKNKLPSNEYYDEEYTAKLIKKAEEKAIVVEAQV